MKVNSLNFQRNGVSGEGFYICGYAMDGESGLIATFTELPDNRTIDRPKDKSGYKRLEIGLNWILLTNIGTLC